MQHCLLFSLINIFDRDTTTAYASTLLVKNGRLLGQVMNSAMPGLVRLKRNSGRMDKRQEWSYDNRIMLFMGVNLFLRLQFGTKLHRRNM